MKQIETVGIKAFSSGVSSYLRKVALGVRVLISDRGRVIAELGEPGAMVPQHSDLHPRLLELQARGLLKVGSGRQVKLPRGEPVLTGLTSQTILDELRGS